MPLDDFIADGHGVWDALHVDDGADVPGEAQGKAERRTHKWRGLGRAPGLGGETAVVLGRARLGSQEPIFLAVAARARHGCPG